MVKKLKVVVAASEVEPFSKSGGLGAVVRSLSRELNKMGHELIIVTPFYEQLIDIKKHKLEAILHDVPIKVDGKKQIKVGFLRGQLGPNLPIYFVANYQYFGKRKALYGSSHENTRYLLFDLAALELLKQIDFKPDLIQCHDWQTGLIPYLLKKNGLCCEEPFYEKIATIFTIHNLAFQMGKDWWKVSTSERDDGKSPLPLFHTDKLENINFAKRAILNADIINTVSETYAQEILAKEQGQELHRLLENRKDKVFGVVNAIDPKDYNPATDPGLARNYSAENFQGKSQNKWWLQKHYGLATLANTPLLAMVSRITEQKGFDILLNIIEPLLRQDLQLIIMGDGDKKYLQLLKKLAKRHPRKLAVAPFARKYETSVYAGSDIFLLPSRFEPYGLTQLISMRYGCIPVAHYIGGIADTITKFSPRTKQGNGFTFKVYSPYDFLAAITRATTTYRQKELWDILVKRVMEYSFSWEMPAREYVYLFKKAIAARFK